MSGKGFLKIIHELDYPPIFLIPPQQFEMLEGEENRESNSLGFNPIAQTVTVAIAAIYYPVISVHPLLSDKELDNAIYHEIAHHLWPWRPHWWIEMFAEKMANGGGRGDYSKKHKKNRADLPSRATLVQMARRQVKKLKKRYYLRRYNQRSLPEEWTPPD